MPKLSTKHNHSTSRHVPYARGFKCPNSVEMVSAIGFKSKPIPVEYCETAESEGNEINDRFFKSIPRPSSIDDWLAQYNEEGQTYLEYLKQCPWLSSRKMKYTHQKFISASKNLPAKYPNGKIYIVPVGDFDENDFVSFNALLDYARRFLCLPVVTLPKYKVQQIENKLIWLDEPSTKLHARSSPRTKMTHLKCRYNTKTGNIQVQVKSLLLKLRENIPQDALCLIGLTCHDLYCDNTDLFVAGMAAGNHRVAIFSLNRYDPCWNFSSEFWYERHKVSGYSSEERKHLILQRSCKLVVHEVCHILGIDHCIFYDCCMNGSGHLEEDFRQPMNLCPVDLHKLQTLCGFAVLHRYEELKQFYQKHNMKDEALWVDRRIKFLKQ